MDLKSSQIFKNEKCQCNFLKSGWSKKWNGGGEPNIGILGKNRHHWNTIRDPYDRVIGEAKISSETPRFHIDSQIFIGATRFLLKTLDFSSENLNFSPETLHFHWRPPDFYWSPKLFIWDPRFEWRNPKGNRKKSWGFQWKDCGLQRKSGDIRWKSGSLLWKDCGLWWDRHSDEKGSLIGLQWWWFLPRHPRPTLAFTRIMTNCNLQAINKQFLSWKSIWTLNLNNVVIQT